MRFLYFLILIIFLSCVPDKRDSKKQKIEVDENVISIYNIKPLKPYPQLKQEVVDMRDIFCKQYLLAQGDRHKQDSILLGAQQYLLSIADDFFRSWYNTPWTFEGHTQTPREGSIACGYFVTTTLRDMGFKLPRIKWAQQASEYVIEKTSSNIKRFSNKPMSDVVEDLKLRGEGLYIVGLDTHVGYIYYIDGQMSFVHSNFYKRDIGVMSESIVGYNPLTHSKYKSIGKILDVEMVRNWVLSIPYSE